MTESMRKTVIDNAARPTWSDAEVIAALTFTLSNVSEAWGLGLDEDAIFMLAHQGMETMREVINMKRAEAAAQGRAS